MRRLFLGISWIDLKRIIRSGYVNFTRNGFVSVASVLVMTVTLLVIGSLIFLNAILAFTLDQIESKVDVTVYFTLDAAESDMLSLKASLEQLPEVQQVTYISRQDALDQFIERHQDDYLTIQALEELDTNPLGALLKVKAIEPSQYESIATFLEGEQALTRGGPDLIEKVNYHQNKLIIDRLQSLMDGAQQLGLLITVVLTAITLVVTFNTIRLTIFIAREEIGVMRLVGADNQYIRGPFMVEGMLYGFVSAVLATLIFFPVTIWLGNTMTAFLGLNLFSYYAHNVIQLFIILLLTGVLLGVISSVFAIRRYLNT